MPKSHSTKKFAIVAFPDEVDKKGNCSLEVIPAGWLIGKTETFWPTHLKRIADLSDVVANCIHPSNNWDKWRIKILEESGKNVFIILCNTKTVYCCFVKGANFV